MDNTHSLNINIPNKNVETVSSRIMTYKYEDVSFNVTKSIFLATMANNVSCVDPFREGGPCNACVPHLPANELLSLIIKCTDFAAKKHSTQRRKDLQQTPYINHPIGVANILVQEGKVYDPVVILGALLHDTVEDTNTTFDEIEQEFGYTVSQVVQEVTDDKSLPKAERKSLQIQNAPKRSHRAKLIILADKLYNLRDLQENKPPSWTPERVKEYFKWAKAVVDKIRRTNSDLETALDRIFAKHVIETSSTCKCDLENDNTKI